MFHMEVDVSLTWNESTFLPIYNLFALKLDWESVRVNQNKSRRFWVSIV